MYWYILVLKILFDFSYLDTKIVENQVTWKFVHVPLHTEKCGGPVGHLQSMILRLMSYSPVVLCSMVLARVLCPMVLCPMVLLSYVLWS